MLRWALDQGDGVFFLPDSCLGKNTANILGLAENRITRLDVRGGGRHVRPAQASQHLYLWPGLCAVHAKFRTSQVEQYRRTHPDARILVHPECSPSVVDLADGAGSTSFLIREAKNAPAGSTLFIGTEWNLVNRLQALHPDKTIRPLHTALCSHMGKITEEKLLHTVKNLDRTPPVRVDENIIASARLALERMLEVCR
jgi:quinolinate synthase